MSDRRGEALYEQFGPGTYGCHEAFHTTSILISFASDLSEHESIKLNPSWKSQIDSIIKQLFVLYQEISREHMPDFQEE